MKPPPFEYLDPREKPEALEALAHHGEDGKILAGGQSLVPLLNMRLAQPRVLIDINRVQALQYIVDRSLDGRPGIAFGAGTRQREVEDADDVLPRLPLLADAISWIGHPQIRNRGTVGGSIAHADPAAELPTVFRTLDGVATVESSRGTRTVAAAEFFLYTFTPDIEPDEMLAEVWLPLPEPRTGQAFLEVARRHGDFALIAVGVSVTLDGDGTVRDARIGIGGASPIPVRASRAEAGLRGRQPDPVALAEAATLAAGETDPTGDIHADADYRREVAGVLTRRALEIALARAAA
jgi:CO/xanthine dehydrogenase FAD-binding subunit